MQREPHTPHTLKAATARLVRANGGITRSAKRIGLSASRVQQLVDEKHRGFMAVNHVLDLELACGDMIVTGFLAHEQGASLMRLPQGAADHRLNVGMARVGETIAHLFGAYEAAVEDGLIPPRAIANLIRAVDDGLSRLSELRGSLQVRRGR